MTNEQLLTIIISLGGLILTVAGAGIGVVLAQSRSIRSELRDVRATLNSGLREAARERVALRDRMDNQIGDLRNHMDRQTGDLRDRMGRIEGSLDILRQFFIREDRGTAA